MVTLARELQTSAEAIGARPAAAFALCLAGEAQLLAGNLEAARTDLLEAVDRFRAIDARAGTAHATQRLAEVELAAGEVAAAEHLARQALPLARWSPIARHLLPRTYGTLIAAAPDRATAAAIADEARQVLEAPLTCEHCELLIAAPAAVAYAETGRLDEARAELDLAEISARNWEGRAMPALLDEARAVLARAEGDEAAATDLLRRAAVGFEQAGQPLDASRCREALAG